MSIYNYLVKVMKASDLENRLIDFAVKATDIGENLPNTRLGNHLAGQLIRSSTAPALNYGEAQSGESRADFIHKMKICLKELRETFVNLKIISRKNIFDDIKLLEAVMNENNELISIFTRSITTAQQNLNNK
jgi:four helix bundle protein